MSAGRHGGGRRRGGHGGHEEHADERWLLTYADMITLLMALFIVMWAISNVNISKFAALRKSLHEAFAGKMTEGGDGVLEGGRQVLQPEGARISSIKQPRHQPEKVMNNHFTTAQTAAAQAADLQNLKALARQVDAYARSHGLAKQIGTTIDERGLIVRLLTDKVLFDSGQAHVKPGAAPLLHEIAQLIKGVHISNSIRVEGNTDSRPIHTYQFRSNWELSTARATAVLQYLLAGGVDPQQMSVAGYADQRPVASNASDYGRYLNRHVDIVVLRRSGVEGGVPRG